MRYFSKTGAAAFFALLALSLSQTGWGWGDDCDQPNNNPDMGFDSRAGFRLNARAIRSDGTYLPAGNYRMRVYVKGRDGQIKWNSKDEFCPSNKAIVVGSQGFVSQPLGINPTNNPFAFEDIANDTDSQVEFRLLSSNCATSNNDELTTRFLKQKIYKEVWAQECDTSKGLFATSDIIGLDGEVKYSLTFPNAPGAPEDAVLIDHIDGNNVVLKYGPVSNSGSGDITSVTAGTGLAGGGLAGAVTLSVDTNFVAKKADLLSEITARTQGDAATLTSSKQYTDASVAAEATARTQGDAAVTTAAAQYTDRQVASEAAARTQAVANEAATRQSADATLERMVNDEATTRTQQDAATLATANDYTSRTVAAEKSERETADGELISAVTAGFGLTGGGDKGDVTLAFNPDADFVDDANNNLLDAFSGRVAFNKTLRVPVYENTTVAATDEGAGSLMFSKADNEVYYRDQNNNWVSVKDTASAAGVRSIKNADGFLTVSSPDGDVTIGLAYDPATQAELDAGFTSVYAKIDAEASSLNAKIDAETVARKQGDVDAVASAVATANQYTNQKSAEATATAVATANEYTNQKSAEAVVTANTYTDQQVAANRGVKAVTGVNAVTAETGRDGTVTAKWGGSLIEDTVVDMAGKSVTFSDKDNDAIIGIKTNAADKVAAVLMQKANGQFAAVGTGDRTDDMVIASSVNADGSAPGATAFRFQSRVDLSTGASTDAVTIKENGDVTAAGNINADKALCIGGDCKTSWPSANGGVQTVTAGAGLENTGTNDNAIIGIKPSGVTSNEIADGAVTAAKTDASVAKQRDLDAEITARTNENIAIRQEYKDADVTAVNTAVATAQTYTDTKTYEAVQTATATAKAYTDQSVAAEAGFRASADLAIQAAFDQEVRDRIAADAAFDGRISATEQSLASKVDRSTGAMDSLDVDGGNYTYDALSRKVTLKDVNGDTVTNTAKGTEYKNVDGATVAKYGVDGITFSDGSTQTTAANGRVQSIAAGTGMENTGTSDNAIIGIKPSGVTSNEIADGAVTAAKTDASIAKQRDLDAEITARTAENVAIRQEYKDADVAAVTAATTASATYTNQKSAEAVTAATTASATYTDQSVAAESTARTTADADLQRQVDGKLSNVTGENGVTAIRDTQTGAVTAKLGGTLTENTAIGMNGKDVTFSGDDGNTVSIAVPGLLKIEKDNAAEKIAIDKMGMTATDANGATSYTASGVTFADGTKQTTAANGRVQSIAAGAGMENTGTSDNAIIGIKPSGVTSNEIADGAVTAAKTDASVAKQRDLDAEITARTNENVAIRQEYKDADVTAVNTATMNAKTYTDTEVTAAKDYTTTAVAGVRTEYVAADTTLQQNIDIERAAWTAAVLQEALDRAALDAGLDSRLTAAETAVTGKVDKATGAMDTIDIDRGAVTYDPTTKTAVLCTTCKMKADDLTVSSGKMTVANAAGASATVTAESVEMSAVDNNGDSLKAIAIPNYLKLSRTDTAGNAKESTYAAEGITFPDGSVQSTAAAGRSSISGADGVTAVTDNQGNTALSLTDNGVTAAKIADGAITAAKTDASVAKQRDLDAEITARTNENIAIRQEYKDADVTAVNTATATAKAYTDQSVAAEAGFRASADLAIQAAFDQEVRDRIAADAATLAGANQYTDQAVAANRGITNVTGENGVTAIRDTQTGNVTAKLGGMLTENTAIEMNAKDLAFADSQNGLYVKMRPGEMAVENAAGDKTSVTAGEAGYTAADGNTSKTSATAIEFRDTNGDATYAYDSLSRKVTMKDVTGDTVEHDPHGVTYKDYTGATKSAYTADGVTFSDGTTLTSSPQASIDNEIAARTTEDQAIRAEYKAADTATYTAATTASATYTDQKSAEAVTAATTASATYTNQKSAEAVTAATTASATYTDQSVAAESTARTTADADLQRQVDGKLSNVTGENGVTAIRDTQTGAVTAKLGGTLTENTAIGMNGKDVTFSGDDGNTVSIAVPGLLKIEKDNAAEKIAIDKMGMTATDANGATSYTASGVTFADGTKQTTAANGRVQSVTTGAGLENTGTSDNAIIGIKPSGVTATEIADGAITAAKTDASVAKQRDLDAEITARTAENVAIRQEYKDADVAAVTAATTASVTYTDQKSAEAVTAATTASATYTNQKSAEAVTAATTASATYTDQKSAEAVTAATTASATYTNQKSAEAVTAATTASATYTDQKSAEAVTAATTASATYTDQSVATESSARTTADYDLQRQVDGKLSNVMGENGVTAIRDTQTGAVTAKLGGVLNQKTDIEMNGNDVTFADSQNGLYIKMRPGEMAVENSAGDKTSVTAGEAGYTAVNGNKAVVSATAIEYKNVDGLTIAKYGADGAKLGFSGIEFADRTTLTTSPQVSIDNEIAARTSEDQAIRTEYAAADTANLAVAKDYSDAGDLTAVNTATMNAKTYTDTEVTAAKDYTTTAVAGVRTEYVAADTASLAAAKDYSDAGDLTAVNTATMNAKAYTDTEVTAAKDYTTTAVADVQRQVDGKLSNGGELDTDVTFTGAGAIRMDSGNGDATAVKSSGIEYTAVNGNKAVASATAVEYKNVDGITIAKYGADSAKLGFNGIEFSDGSRQTTASSLGGTIGADELEDASVTAAKIAVAAVGDSQLADNSVNFKKILDGSVLTEDIAANAIDEIRLADNAVNSKKIANRTVFAEDVALGTITSAEVDASIAKQADLAAESAGRMAEDSSIRVEIKDGDAGAVESANAYTDTAVADLTDGYTWTGAHVFSDLTVGEKSAPGAFNVRGVASFTMTDSQQTLFRSNVDSDVPVIGGARVELNNVGGSGLENVPQVAFVVENVDNGIPTNGPNTAAVAAILNGDADGAQTGLYVGKDPFAASAGNYNEGINIEYAQTGLKIRPTNGGVGIVLNTNNRNDLIQTGIDLSNAAIVESLSLGSTVIRTSQGTFTADDLYTAVTGQANGGVQSVTAANGLENTGTASAPIIGIKSAGVTAAQLAPNSVTTAAIKDLSVTAAKVDGSIATQTALATETSARVQGDSDTLTSANRYTDSAVANINAVGGTGTKDAIAKFTAANTIAASQISDDGTNVAIANTLTVAGMATLNGATSNASIGINTTSAALGLDVSNPAGIQSTSADLVRINAKSTASTGAALNITTATTSGGMALRVNDDGTLTDSTPFLVDQNGNVSMGTTDIKGTRLTVSGKIQSAATGNPGANNCGTNPAVIGTDTVGQITVGTASVAAITACSITFAQSYPVGTTPRCLLTSVGASPIALGITSASNSGFTVVSGNTNMAGLGINYMCIAN